MGVWIGNTQRVGIWRTGPRGSGAGTTPVSGTGVSRVAFSCGETAGAAPSHGESDTGVSCLARDLLVTWHHTEPQVCITCFRWSDPALTKEQVRVTTREPQSADGSRGDGGLCIPPAKKKLTLKVVTDVSEFQGAVPRSAATATAAPPPRQQRRHRDSSARSMASFTDTTRVFSALSTSGSMEASHFRVSGGGRGRGR